MIDERIEQLMWQEIDGEISTADRAELEALLAENADVREHYRELSSMRDALEPGEELDPPVQLRQRIDTAIDWDRYAPLRSRASAHARAAGGGWVERLFPSGWGIRLVPTAAAAFLLGIIGYQLGVRDAAPGDSRFYGAMLPIGNPVSEMTIDLDGAHGTVDFEQKGDVTVSQLTLTSDEDIEVTVRFPGEPLEFGALGKAENPLHDFFLDGNALTVKHRGANTYYLVFRSGPGPVDVRVSGKNGALFEDQWVPGPGSD